MIRINKRKTRRAAVFLTGVMVAVAVLAGCGRKITSSGEKRQTQEDSLAIKGDMYYTFEVRSIPDANRELSAGLPITGWIEDGWNFEGGVFACVDHTLFRNCRSCYSEEVGESVYIHVEKEYAQFMEPPYERWESIVVDREGWQEGKTWIPEDFKVTADGRMLAKLYTWREEDIEYAIGEIQKDGSQVILQQGIAGGDDIETVWQEDSAAEKVLEYMDMYVVAKSSQVAKTYDAAGNLYFGTARKIWRYDGEQVTELMDLREYDVAFKELTNIQVVENGFLLMGSFGDKFYLVKALETPQPVNVEKTEIVIADLYLDEMLRDAIADFNMQSREYRIVVQEPKGTDQTAQEQFRQDLQMELSKGAGPDILNYYAASDMDILARKGYLMNLDEFDAAYGGILDENNFWECALEAGRVDGKRYAIPYSMMLNFYTIPGERTQEMEAWDARALMKYVEKSGATYLQFERYNNGSAVNDLMSLMMDAYDTTYIDWQNGISHLDEKPFLELLEFVKKYSIGDKQISYEDAGSKIQSGEIALFDNCVQDLSGFVFLDKMYSGNPHYIGYPTSIGKGISAFTYLLCVNANTTKMDGIREFFRYLLSDEGQMNTFTVQYPNGMPVRKSTFMWMLNTRGEGTAWGKGQIHCMGVSYRMQYLTDAQKEQIVWLAEHAETGNPELYAIRDILEEETGAYFSGNKSARDVAKILHSRVQLYLDERK